LNGVGEPGRAYAVQLDRSLLSAGGRAALPGLRFLLAVCAPDCNPQTADGEPKQPAEVEALLRAAWDSMLDCFWRSCQKYCD
jgi:hypothetical protein